MKVQITFEIEDLEALDHMLNRCSEENMKVEPDWPHHRMMATWSRIQRAIIEAKAMEKKTVYVVK